VAIELDSEVYDREKNRRWWGDEASNPKMNVGQAERALSLAGGLALLTAGGLLAVKRHSPFGAVLAGAGSSLAWRGLTGHCWTYDWLGVDTEDAHRWSHPLSHAIVARHSEVIHRPRLELYQYWRDFENLPNVMRHLERVEVINEARSKWTARGPRGRNVTWDALVMRDLPGDYIEWASTDDSEVQTWGRVDFQALPPRGETTLMHVNLRYRPPAGIPGLVVARMLGNNPNREIAEDLERFKEFVDSGGIPVGMVKS